MTSIGERSLVRNLHYLSEAQAVTSNNLANVTSDGFKRRVSVAQETGSQFDDFLGAHFPESSFNQHIDWTPGSFTRTSDPSKFALRDPKLFVQVQTDEGHIAYTRTGDLTLDSENQLRTKTGHLVLDDVGQPIQITDPEGNGTPSISEIRVSPNGQLLMGNVALSRMGLYEVEDVQNLRALGTGTYAYTGKTPLRPARTNDVIHGFVEQSNTDSVSELVQMISNQRGFQTTMSALQTLGRIKESYVSAFNQ